MAEMMCTVVVTWMDAKKKKTAYAGTKYLMANGVLAIESRELDADGAPIKVKTHGIALSLIASYEATYEKVDVSKNPDE